MCTHMIKRNVCICVYGAVQYVHVHMYMHCMCRCTCIVCADVHALYVHMYMHCTCRCTCIVCAHVHALYVQMYMHCMCTCTCIACAPPAPHSGMHAGKARHRKLLCFSSMSRSPHTYKQVIQGTHISTHKSTHISTHIGKTHTAPLLIEHVTVFGGHHCVLRSPRSSLQNYRILYPRARIQGPA